MRVRVRLRLRVLTWLRFGCLPPAPGLGEAELADSEPAGLSEASTSESAISTPGCATWSGLG